MKKNSLCRRDGIPATAKILEKSLRLLFEKRDLSLVRAYVQHQFAKITAATISIQEMTFAKVRYVKHAYVQHQFAKITAATISIQEMIFAKVRVCEACLCTASVRQDHRRHHLHPGDDLRQGESTCLCTASVRQDHRRHHLHSRDDLRQGESL
jgi:hypothetical protein